MIIPVRNEINQERYLFMTLKKISIFIFIISIFTFAGCYYDKPVVKRAPDFKPNTEKAPKDATVLFDGTDFSQWTHEDGSEVKWEKMGDAMQIVVGTGSIITKENYQNFKLHVEFKVPQQPPLLEEQNRGNRGNSGIYIQGRYEVQILDSYDIGELKNFDCGSIYTTKKPDKNVSRMADKWQSFDITFYGAVFKDGKKTENARITVYQNNEKIHSNFSIPDKTGAGQPEGPEPGPIKLQDHQNEVMFRNIWILPLE